MGPRDHYPDRQGHRGVETVAFNSQGFQLGKIGPENFDQQFGRIRDAVYRGKGDDIYIERNFKFHFHWQVVGLKS